MKWQQNVDSLIKNAFNEEAGRMKEEGEFYFQIKQQVYMREREKAMKQQRMNKKVVLVGICTVLLTTGTLIASRVKGWDIQLLKSYEQPPTYEQIKEESDFAPKFVEELPGGYSFMMASTHKGELVDEKSRVTDEGHELILRYFAPGENEEHAIAFFATDISENMSLETHLNHIDIEENGIQFKLVEYTDKYVKKGYKITSEEQEQIDEGKLIVEETDDEYYLEIGVKHVQELAWIDHNIRYALLGANGHEFTQDEFMEMARAIINSRE